ncbi:unnamed protein product [Anisakis simplex]|uniref:Glutamine-dependent NAD(+) synthetase (inferred by orthology to a human protein) n=1 Tax=Anisakis simplex TaxID=6269 RepID=A0A0M3KKR6_ANISI|nr:unnamed protein product [Anisakis simplex]
MIVIVSVEIGLTYEEMAEIGQLRKPGCCGPYGTFLKLLPLWHDMTPEEIAKKVKRFYWRYGANRHKATVLTPGKIYYCLLLFIIIINY